MKTPTLILIPFLALMSLNAYAAGGDGTRGGGQVVYVDGTERLRDLVEPSLCENKTGEELRAADPSIDVELNKLAGLDWYFAEALRHEINQLQFCFTTKLIRLKKNDDDSVIAHDPHEQIRNVAIRFAGTYDVYVDAAMNSLLPAGDQTYLPIHEAMHGFIPWDAPRRIESVMTAVNTVYQVAQGKITNARKLHSVLETKGHVVFPWTAKQLAPYRSAVTFALSSLDDQRSVFKSAKDINSVIEIKPEALQYTYYAHLSAFTVDMPGKVSALLEEYSDDFTLLDQLVNPAADAAPITVIDPVLVALSVSTAKEDSAYLHHVLDSAAMKKGLSLYARLKDKGFKIVFSRIYGTQGFQFLGENTVGQTTIDRGEVVVPALSVTPYSSDGIKQAPAEIQGLVQFIVSQANLGAPGWATLENALSKNDGFYAAFGVTDLYAKLDALDAPIAREKTRVRAMLPDLVTGFRSLIIASVRAQVTGDEAARDDIAKYLDQSIDWARLGQTTPDKK